MHLFIYALMYLFIYLHIPIWVICFFIYILNHKIMHSAKIQKNSKINL